MIVKEQAHRKVGLSTVCIETITGSKGNGWQEKKTKDKNWNSTT